jgi:NTE family protein
MAVFGWAMLRYPDPARAQARIGRMALAAPTVPEAARRAVIAARVPSEEWPARRLLVTAIDAVTGEFAALDAGSGVSLVDAVGASCAVPGVYPPVTMAGRRWIDGGVRSPANAYLAAGCERIVVLAPVPRGIRAASAAAYQAARLTRAGHAVAVVSPDRAAVAAIGRNVLDPARRAPAARAGHAQAGPALDRVGTVWDG